MKQAIGTCVRDIEGRGGLKKKVFQKNAILTLPSETDLAVLRYPLNASPYEGVEFVWNHQNFWVCMQVWSLTRAWEAAEILSCAPHMLFTPSADAPPTLGLPGSPLAYLL